MNFKFTQILILFLINTLTFYAQTTNWVKSFGSINNESFVLSKIDNNNNIYTTGIYTNTINYASFSIPHFGLGDVFIEKRNENGDLLWAKGIGGTENESVFAISVTDDGGIIISGVFYGTLDTDPSINVHNLVSNGETDAYLIKLDANGDFAWAKNFGSTENDAILAMNVDTTGNIVLSGLFRGTLRLSSNDTIELPESSHTTALIKLNSNADVLWAYDTGFTIVRDIAFDINNNIYLTGEFFLEQDFDYGIHTFLMKETWYDELGGPFSNDAFIQKITPDANFIWAKQLKNLHSITGYSITVDSQGNVYTSGIWQGTSSSIPFDVDFDPSDDTPSFFTPHSENSKIFVHKLDALGNFEWVNSFGLWVNVSHHLNLNPEQGGFVILDNNDNLYFAGDVRSGRNNSFEGDVRYGSFEFGGETYTPDIQNLFLAKLNTTNGAPEWSTMIESPGSENNMFAANFDANNNLIISGSFTNSTNFSINPTNDLTRSSIGEEDAFLMKIKPTATLGVNDKIDELTTTIYPSITTGIVHIKKQGDIKIASILVYDFSGRFILETETDNKEVTEINLNHLVSGPYIIKLLTDKGKSFTKKVIKK